jgi:hypothetical protein
MVPATDRVKDLVKALLLTRRELRKIRTSMVIRRTWPEHLTRPVAVSGCGKRRTTPILHVITRAGVAPIGECARTTIPRAPLPAACAAGSAAKEAPLSATAAAATAANLRAFRACPSKNPGAAIALSALCASSQQVLLVFWPPDKSCAARDVPTHPPRSSHYDQHEPSVAGMSSRRPRSAVGGANLWLLVASQ